MASIKSLKKDIDFALAEFSGDCFIAQAVVAAEDGEQVENLFEETYNKAIEIYRQIKSYDKSKGKEAAKARQSYFLSLRGEFNKLIEESSNKLVELIEKNSKK